MKILYLIDNFSLGGSQTIIKGIMDNAGTDRTIFAFGLREKEPRMQINHPQATCFPGTSKYSFKSFRYLKKYIVDNQIDIIHCQLPRSIVYGYLLKRAFPKIKYIIHESGDIFESKSYSLVLRRIAKYADTLIACSKATRQELSKRASIQIQRVHVIYNLVDLKRFQPTPSSIKIKTIGFAGRIEKRKGWFEFVMAAKHFSGQKELSFLIAGTGGEEGKLLKIVDKIGSSTIRHLGFVERIENFYKQIDLLVVPSHFEPMGMVAIEAMACGTPVLATNVPGLNEVVRHEQTGWTYHTQDIEQLIRALDALCSYSPEKINTIIKNGIQYAKDFSIANYMKQLNKVYSELN